MLEALDEVLMNDFPRLMQAFPMDAKSKPTALELNPFAAEVLFLCGCELLTLFRRIRISGNNTTV